ncbi:MAG: Flp pilus assembly complex ATPase component TadA [Actinobacteria bacterium]|nr:Flp pilus assembly complex ATPase component TadA [Actinomycetota bacterium]
MEASVKTSAVTAISAGRRRLGALLVADGLVSQHQIEAALARQKVERRRLGDVLVREGLVSERDLVEALAAQLRLEVADLDQIRFSPETLALLPRDFMVNRRVLPLEIEEDGTLVLAMTDPLDIVALDEVRLRTKRDVRAVICTETAFDEASSTFFNTRGKLRELGDEDDPLGADDAALAHDASIIEVVDSLISDAVSMKASDIHIEPHAEGLHVRCRIDGVLHKLREFPTEVQAGVISRIKIMGSMDIAERRLPQDGRISFETSTGDEVDLRLASIPTLHGENLSIRILEVSPLPPTLDQLGLTGASLERFEAAVRRPEGGILICGPTGCGKSTTLYTTLELVKSPESKIYTVEDPIERKLEGVMQSEVKAAIGLDFAGLLRTLLRSDPDVIMVGEIRDAETARMAAEAAMTGHLVFSTLHTRDAASAVHRLVEMGLPPYLVSAAFTCVVSQRLVRRLCPHCRKAKTVRASAWEKLGLGEAPRRQMKVYEAVGCTRCYGTGYLGRVGIYEVLDLDESTADMIEQGVPVGDLRAAARARGVEFVREDGVARYWPARRVSQSCGGWWPRVGERTSPDAVTDHGEQEVIAIRRLHHGQDPLHPVPRPCGRVSGLLRTYRPARHRALSQRADPSEPQGPRLHPG